MARTVTIVNDALGIRAVQTTTAMVAALAARGHECWVASVDSLGMDETGEASIAARQTQNTDVHGIVADMRAATQDRLRLGKGDLVLLRTNPGRDPRPWAHQVLFELARAAQESGAVVLNDPTGLARASSKLFLRSLPAHTRPRTVVSRDPVELRTFVESCGSGAVLKPLDGTQGRDVFRLLPGQNTNRNQIIDLLTRAGHAMAQEFVPEALAGDVRLIMLDGEVLQVDGVAAAVRRVPGGDDFRSNVHVGGTAVPAVLTPALEAVASAVGPVLRAEGLFLCGLDVIGDKVVEANVFSPGGLTDASAFGSVDFLSRVVDAMEAHLE